MHISDVIGTPSQPVREGRWPAGRCTKLGTVDRPDGPTRSVGGGIDKVADCECRRAVHSITTRCALTAVIEGFSLESRGVMVPTIDNVTEDRANLSVRERHSLERPGKRPFIGRPVMRRHDCNAQLEDARGKMGGGRQY